MGNTLNVKRSSAPSGIWTRCFANRRHVFVRHFGCCTWNSEQCHFNSLLTGFRSLSC